MLPRSPKLVTRVDEPYRKVAERKHLHGVAIIELIIDTSGRVCAARVLRGLDADFDRAALVALRQWTFRPALNYSGQPVTVAFNVTAKAK
jgi:TonB family protein